MKPFRSIALHTVMAILAIATLTPGLWMLSASLMPAGEASTFPPTFIPSTISFEHYETLFTRLEVGKYLANSLILSIVITAVSLFFNSMAGYAFAKYRFAGKDRLFRLLVAEMVIPAQVTTLPLFLMLNKVGLVNTYFGVIVAGMATIYGIFLIRQFTLSIPDSLIEAARMDGASEFKIYWSVILPLCRPILVTLAVFTFLGAWNDFFWPLIVLTDDSMYTLPVALAILSGEHVQDTELMMAGAVLTILPVMIVFLATQKYYIEGIMMGGVKG